MRKSGKKPRGDAGTKRRKAATISTSIRSSTPAIETASSLRGIADALGCSLSAVRKWRARRDWPFGDGPFDIDRIRAWRAKTLPPDPTVDPEGFAASRHYGVQPGATEGGPTSSTSTSSTSIRSTESPLSVLAQMKLEELAIKIAERKFDFGLKTGELVKKADVRSQVSAHLQAAKAELMTVPAACAPLVVNERDRAKVEGIIGRFIFDVLMRLSRGLAAVTGESLGSAEAQRHEGGIPQTQEPTHGSDGNGSDAATQRRSDEGGEADD